MVTQYCLYRKKKELRIIYVCELLHLKYASIVADVWPLPYIDELFLCIRGARYFYLLDLYDSYH